MDTIRNKEEIKERLTRSIAWYDDRIKAWEHLTYNDKINMNYDEFINKLKKAVIR